MRIYFERTMQCAGCKKTQRQTVTKIPLDWIGKSIAETRQKNFEYWHQGCNSRVEYTPWRLGKCFLKDFTQ